MGWIRYTQTHTHIIHCCDNKVYIGFLKITSLKISDQNLKKFFCIANLSLFISVLKKIESFEAKKKTVNRTSK